MRRILVLRFACCLALLAAAGIGLPDEARADQGNVNFFLGFKMLDEDDWEPVEDHGEFGAEVTIGPTDWPVQIALDAFFSAGEEEEFGTDFEVNTQEFGVGVRKIWEVGNVRPYIGGGLAAIRADVEISVPGFGSADDDDLGVGAWVGGGVFWRIGQAFNIGLAGRFSTADVDFDGSDVDAGGLHGGLLLGWGW